MNFNELFGMVIILIRKLPNAQAYHIGQCKDTKITLNLKIKCGIISEPVGLLIIPGHSYRYIPISEHPLEST